MESGTLPAILDRLEAAGGPAPGPAVTDPWEQVLWENVAYLANDRRRAEGFAALRQRAGTAPEAILAAPQSTLVEICGVAGIMPELRADRLRRCAEIVLHELGGDLHAAASGPFPAARQALKRFPGIGDPGAERILLFAACHAVPALESNGLRTLLRLGFGEEGANYAAGYRSAQNAIREQLPAECEPLVRAYQLLRRHGQQVCKNTRPRCAGCVLAAGCGYRQAAEQQVRHSE